ncbi:unnamed protein product [Phyllotreta striolata]|uniref:Uncharacterized protein n=1 Tax=Phyllotreta striolata TaxID=444603 RepID=A0A9N9U2P3_PHYSR|nr:unnamed protein product [Phyllotreta striolata]
MCTYIICGTSGGGLPLFSRKKGNSETLPFSIVGSLNGIHMFGKPLGIEILETLTDDYAVCWREFEDSIILIGVASGCSVEVLNQLLEEIFNTIVLVVGIKELKTQRNIERLKRELRLCLPVIDRLLDSLDSGDANNQHASDIVGFVETTMCQENHLIQTVLDSFSESVDSSFCCVLIDGKISAATESWWSLHPVELRLLSFLAVSENTTDSKDFPVFLPYKSPTVAFRFVVCLLVPNVQICCLCGLTPTLQEIEHSVKQCFKNSTDLLTAAKNYSPNFNVDTNILGHLLINITAKKYVMSKSLQQSAKKSNAGNSHRIDILRTFFYRAVVAHLVDDSDDENVGLETYWCSEYHKCHAVRTNDNVLCVLYNSTVPTHALNGITEKTLRALVSDKQVCW